MAESGSCEVRGAGGGGGGGKEGGGGVEARMGE